MYFQQLIYSHLKNKYFPLFKNVGYHVLKPFSIIQQATPGLLCTFFNIVKSLQGKIGEPGETGPKGFPVCFIPLMKCQ